jgi:prophage antirepressor-like protein
MAHAPWSRSKEEKAMMKMTHKNKHRAMLSPVTAIFDNASVRRTSFEGQTYYAAADIVRALAHTEHPEEYLFDLKVREPALAALMEKVAFGGDELLDGVTAADALRLVQSIPSNRAEKIRLWLAEAARQRIEETENPELAVLRTRELYERKGYSRRWIDKRTRGVSSRQELTSEWAKRGASESDDYRQLTNELFQSAFGMDVAGYRSFKRLTGRPNENLRDHMTDLELVLTTLGEATATVLSRDRNAHGVEELTEAARAAGTVVATAKAEIERLSGKEVTNPGNHLWRRVA